MRTWGNCPPGGPLKGGLRVARPRVLVLSELYPNPVKPAFGIFVERQTHHLGAFCDVHVVAPVRVFPPLRL